MSLTEAKSAKRAQVNIGRLLDFYMLAKRVVVDEGFSEEIRWQESIRFSTIGERDFLREAAWVVLSAGMRESVIRRKFSAVSASFMGWQSAEVITKNAQNCRRNASRIFAHPGKINSIIDIAGRIMNCGFEAFKKEICDGGVDFLRSLPFIGPVTCYHLAKNIGLDVVKPDRHLVRVSILAGYANPSEFCQSISDAVGDRLAVVDLVVWRYATLNPGYREFLVKFLH
jgi:hypothetical protein